MDVNPALITVCANIMWRWKMEVSRNKLEKLIDPEKVGDIKLVSKVFLDYFLKYKNVKIKEDVLDVIAPLPLYALLVKCPLLVYHYKNRQHAEYREHKEQALILRILTNQRYKNLTNYDMQTILDDNKVVMTVDVINKIIQTVEKICEEDSTPSFAARVMVDRTYSVVDPVTDKPLMNFKNFLTVLGAKNYHVFYIKYTDHDYTEPELNFFNDALFLHTLAGMTKTVDKDVVISVLMVRPNDIMVPLRWTISRDFFEQNGATPQDLLKGYITHHFDELAKILPDLKKVVKAVVAKKVTFCARCGYGYLKEGTFREAGLIDAIATQKIE
jgi:hypothetical protein